MKSQANPMRIDWMPVLMEVEGYDLLQRVIPDSGGALGITFCPGRKARGILANDRDLRADIESLKAMKVSGIVSMLADTEHVDPLGVPGLYEGYLSAGLVTYRVPMRNVAPPNDLDQLRIVIGQVYERVQAGDRMVVHCQDGMGRSGIFAALWLIYAGVCRTGADAISTVRRLREGVIETHTQLSYIGMVAMLARSWRLERDAQLAAMGRSAS